MGSHEIIVQEQLSSPSLSGVVATAETAQSLYHRVEYTLRRDGTSDVTSGRPCSRVYLSAAATSVGARWQPLLKAIRAVQRTLDDDSLLIEFGINRVGRVYIFQARRTRVKRSGASSASMVRGAQMLLRSTKALRRMDPVALSAMADWNPAEMLGEHPRPLDTALYREVIGRTAWLAGRRSLGYAQLKSSQLFVMCAGAPYVDLWKSFLSLVPKSVSPREAELYVGNRIAFLRAHRELHDKVEFDVLVTSASVDLDRRLRALGAGGVPGTVVRALGRGLRGLTEDVLQQWPLWSAEDARAVVRLEQWRERNAVGKPASETGLRRSLAFALEAIDVCRKSGAVAFARQARLAFIARDLWLGLHREGLVSRGELDGLYHNVGTVSAEFRNAAALGRGHAVEDSMRRVYGHLRPSTYSIRSPRYDQLDWPDGSPRGSAPRPDYLSVLTKVKKASIDRALQQSALRVTAEEGISFLLHTTRSRELLKFAFTALLSDALEALAGVGSMCGLGREEMSFLSLLDIRQASEATMRGGMGTLLHRAATRGRAQWEAGDLLTRPETILGADEITAVEEVSAKPTFITTRRITGPVVQLTRDAPQSRGVFRGAVVAMEAIDPGCEWVFLGRPGGLITKWGGALSHAAVRCAELGLPAAIGCGGATFEAVLTSSRVCLDCGSNEIRGIGPRQSRQVSGARA